MRSFYLHARTAHPWVRSIIWVNRKKQRFGSMSWTTDPPRYCTARQFGRSDYGPLLKVKSRL